ncbi:hypothetical protein PILCRDRAFT_812394 [Piloderma croceum F 1598]|uniref:Uncharacterized protein n=1 Tax=Piloderma croceum (strain F 1598) TaxID=765440 RepID=A0A0C3CIE7_PILCF|nr:hypothetical protein PILCRDRAFT_812394 [Piloderma croceum F 1598]
MRIRWSGFVQFHKSTDTLLVVPRYSDLLDDQDDEDESERGRLLVSSSQCWRAEMAKWIVILSRAAEQGGIQQSPVKRSHRAMASSRASAEAEHVHTR